MMLSRRNLLRLALGIAATPALSRLASARAYPMRPVRLFVGFAAGSPIDTCARLIGQWLTHRMGQSFVIENRPGASGNLAAETVAHAPADGHTLLTTGTFNSISTIVYEKLSFDFERDLLPVASISRTGGVMAVNPDFPAASVPEFIAYAKANPGKINIATSGPASAPSLYCELFKAITGVDLVTVSYRGAAPALIDLLSGQVQVSFVGIPAALEHVRSGKLRALGVTTAMRSTLLPDLPAIGEFVPGYEASGWQGIGAPVGTAPEIVAALNAQVNGALADATFNAKLTQLGMEPFATSPERLASFISEYTEKWRKVLASAHIRPI